MGIEQKKMRSSLLRRLNRRIRRRVKERHVRSIFKMAYGTEPSRRDLDRLHAFGVSDTSSTSSQLRAMICAFEQYSHGTPVSVRFGKDDLIPIKNDKGFTFLADRHDYAVGRKVITKGEFEPHVTAM